MTGRVMLGLGVVGLLLAGTIVLELRGIVADDGAMHPIQARPSLPRPAPVAAPVAPADGRQAWVETLLSRPLFVVGRRPASTPSGPAAPPTALPRLAGVLVHGERRSAIFAAAGGGRPVVAGVGEQVGAYAVQSIEAGQVTLAGPGGTQVLRPSFDARAGDARAGAAGSPGVPPGVNAAPFAAAPFAPAPFANAVDIMPSLRGLPGFAGPAAR